MKELYMIRHAKSDWKNGVSDFERGLNKRGVNDAPLMGKVLKKLSILPDLIVTSPANRAKTTAYMIAKEIGYDQKKIVDEELLYLADVKTFYNVINSLDDKYNSVMIFSHNNGITDFVNSLTNSDIYNIPTCGVAYIKIDLDSWRYVTKGVGELVYFDFPKNHKSII